jgi:hypothetical protein
VSDTRAAAPRSYTADEPGRRALQLVPALRDVLPVAAREEAIRALGRFDRRFLGGAIERRVRAYDEKTYGPSRHIHPTGIFETEEDDQVLFYSMAAGFWITKMPYMGDLDFYYVDRWPERKKRRMMRFYADCIRRQLYLNGRHRTHLSKNPVFPGRLATLLETFPDARIVIPCAIRTRRSRRCSS